MASTTHPNLVLRLKKEASYISIPTLCLHSMPQGELCFSGMGQYFKIPVPLDFTLETTFVYHEENFVTDPLPV
jgi:hypothetical protein